MSKVHVLIGRPQVIEGSLQVEGEVISEDKQGVLGSIVVPLGNTAEEIRATICQEVVTRAKEEFGKEISVEDIVLWAGPS